MKQCPYCGEEVQESAKKCKHCKEFLDDSKPYKYSTKSSFFSRLKAFLYQKYVRVTLLIVVLCILWYLWSVSDRAKSYNNEWFNEDKKGNYASALILYDKAIKTDSTFSLAYANKCLTLERLGRYKEAIENCDIAISQSKNKSKDSNVYSTALNNKGLILLETNDLTWWIWYINDSLREDENDPYALGNKWYYYFLIKEYDQALPYFNQALSKDIDNNQDKWTILSNKWLVLLDKGDLSNWIIAIDNALTLSPSNAYALANKWYYYILKGDYNNALTYLQRSNSVNPNIPAVMWNIAFVHYFQWNNREGLKYSSDCLSNSPNDMSCLMIQWVMNYADGNIEDSIRDTSKLLRYQTDEEEVELLSIMVSALKYSFQDPDYTQAVNDVLESNPHDKVALALKLSLVYDDSQEDLTPEESEIVNTLRDYYPNLDLKSYFAEFDSKKENIVEALQSLTF